MPNYVAHEVFGAQVQEYLQQPLRRAVESDPEAFRCGLYGPDPLLFLPGGLHLSRLLHRTWREQAAPKLQTALESGVIGEISFAVGYLCHLILDDFCHQRIYQFMEEDGLSHRGLEVGLDWIFLHKMGEARFPVPRVEEKKRICELASRLIQPVKPLEYRMGLSSMGMLCTQMDRVGKLYRKKFTLNYQEAIQELHEIFQKAVSQAAEQIELFAVGEFVPMEGQVVPAC